MTTVNRLQEVLDEPLEFIRRLKIKDKRGKLISFVPNQEQIKIINSLHSGASTLVFKSRQIGSTTAVAAYFFWRWYTSQDPITLVMLSHKLASSKHILKMHKIFYDSLPKKMQRALSTINTLQMTLADTGATLQAESAQGDGGIRSFTCSYLHLSEFAFAENPEELKAAAISALNNGQLVMESTANYYGDALHQEILSVQQGLADWALLEFYWWEHTEYSMKAPPAFTPTQEELDLQERYDLTIDQLYWRSVTSRKIGYEKFKREYPACLEDAFAQTGNAYYTEGDLRYITPIKVEPKELTILLPAHKDDTYAIGCDVSSGVGRDYSVAVVMSKNNYQPVAIYRSNTANPVAFARQIFHLSNSYGEAKVLIESNNWGLPVINELKNMSFLKFWKDQDGKDWTTTTKSKLILHEELKALISEGVITNLDTITLSEIRSLVLDDKGLAPTVPANLPHHADSVIALALAAQCLKSVVRKTSAFLPDFIKNSKAKKIASTTMGFSNTNRR